MREENRRKLLMGAAVLAGGAGLGALSGCAAGGKTVDPAVIDQVNQTIAQTCNVAVVMAATTIVGVMTAQFPLLLGLATLAPDAAKEVATFLCGLIPKLTDKLGDMGPVTAVVGGKTVEVHGFHMVNGKSVWF